MFHHGGAVHRRGIESLNVVFFALAMTWMILGLAMVKNARQKSGDTDRIE